MAPNRPSQSKASRSSKLHGIGNIAASKENYCPKSSYNSLPGGSNVTRAKILKCNRISRLHRQYEEKNIEKGYNDVHNDLNEAAKGSSVPENNGGKTIAQSSSQKLAR